MRERPSSSLRSSHGEHHVVGRLGWLRAAVLGANDGVLSTASLIIGVASANATHGAVLVAGVAGLVAGSMSMSAGEYVSVSSQADSERADLARERSEIESDRDGELRELTAIYVERGLQRSLAIDVATQLMAHDALAAHARDELGISDTNSARPVQAALTSAAAFAVGGALPLAIAVVVPLSQTVVGISLSSLAFLALLGGLGAKTGGGHVTKAALRVTFWGALAMAVTAGIGALFGTHA